MSELDVELSRAVVGGEFRPWGLISMSFIYLYFGEMSMIRGLVLSGGGACGIAHVGAMEVLEDRGILDQLTHYSCASAGAMVGAALACGAQPEFIKNHILSVDLNKFLDQRECMVKKVLRFLKVNGANSGETVETWVGDWLQELTGNSEISFREVYDRYGKFLEINVTDLTMGGTVYYNHHETPNMMVKTAVRRSCMIPVVFSPSYEKQLTALLNSQNVAVKQNLMHVMIDGGVLDNYPIRRLDGLLSQDQVIGVKLITFKELRELQNPNLAQFQPPVKLVDYVMSILTILRNQALRLHVEDSDWQRTIPIDIGTISSTNFSLSDGDKIFLVNQGRLAAEKFLDGGVS